MKLTTPKATVIAALIALTGIVIGSFLNPLAEKLINRPASPPEAASLPLEQLPQQVFAYAGNNNPQGGGSIFRLLYDEKSLPIYQLEYSLPGDTQGYAGLAFQLQDGPNLSAYRAVECTLLFTRLNDVVDLYFKDIAGNFNTVRVANNGANEMAVRYEFGNFPKINFNAVQEFGLVISTDFSTGEHQAAIRDVRFVK